MGLSYSLIVPVFNRPEEIHELLQSISDATKLSSFEVVIVEDGSTRTSEEICSRFRESVNLIYLPKPNTGPGDSRNYGMSRARADIFIILDSDCILPVDYFVQLEEFLSKSEVDCFGGVDMAHPDFSDLQKAIDFTMTSFLTTGGVRGNKRVQERFQPRSFNMGLSRKAFEATGGFSNLHPGEDPELVFKLWKNGFKTALAPNLKVYHKRRISLNSFNSQMRKFGKARVVLNRNFPEYKKITFWYPTVFTLGLAVSLVLMMVGFYIPILLYVCYFTAVLILCTVKYGLSVGILSVLTTFIQFLSYALGFMTAWIKVNLLNRSPERAMPELYFNR